MYKSQTLIAIPVYNAEDAIRLTLDSCVAQTKKTSIVVVDNRSSDNTCGIVKEYAKKYPQIKLIVNNKNLGRVGNWNRCLDIFREMPHEHIKFVFSGDTIKANCIEEVEKVFKLHPKTGAVFWPYEFINKNQQISVTRYANKSLYISPKKINTIHITKKGGGILGAIICNTYSKKAIGDLNFSSNFIGKLDFDFKLFMTGKYGIYYVNRVLSSFDLNHRGTFGYALNNYRLNIEVAWARTMVLENVSNGISKEKYKKYKDQIMIDLMDENLCLLGYRSQQQLLGQVTQSMIGGQGDSNKKIGLIKQILSPSFTVFYSSFKRVFDLVKSVVHIKLGWAHKNINFVRDSFNSLKRQSRLLPSVVLYVTSFITPRFKRVWVFGSRLGQFYNDNSRYLFEYVCDNHPEIKAIWITNNQIVYKYLKKKGRLVYYSYSLRGILYALIAKVAVFCVVNRDLNPFTLGGATKVNLWHSTHIKYLLKNYPSVDDENEPFNKLTTHAFFKTDLQTVSAPNQVAIQTQFFGLKKKQLKVTGLPRTDILTRNYKSIRKYFSFKNNGQRIIAYMPTHRDSFESAGNPYDLFTRYKFNQKKLEKVLKKHNACLVYLPHYSQNIDKTMVKQWRESKYLHIQAKRHALDDFAESLKHIDIMMTDYSGGYLDYLFLNRPIIFTPFDLEFYSKNCSGLAFKYDQVTPGPKAKDWNEVCSHLDKILEGNIDTYIKDRKRIRPKFHSWTDGQSSKRVFQEIMKTVTN
jgi:CDP-glycerol glycerophosphotransferase (TagB/SpsB family)